MSLACLCPSLPDRVIDSHLFSDTCSLEQEDAEPGFLMSFEDERADAGLEMGQATVG
jgi:hypothetical protein